MSRPATRLRFGDPRDTGLSIVVPALDEADSIEAQIEGLLTAARECLPEDRFEILIVNDGSRDATADKAKSFEEQGVVVLSHRRIRGYGASLKSGIDRARFPWILITDADGTYPSDRLSELMAMVPEADMAVGARNGGERNIPWMRRPAKWVIRRLASWLSGRPIPDLNSGLRIFPEPMARKFWKLLPDGFSFTSTMTLSALASGYRIRYLPIDYHKRKGRSKIRPLRDTVGFLTLLLRTTIFFDPLRVLLPLSLLFFLASATVGVGSLAWTGQLMDVTTVLLFVTGVQMLTLGVVADAINRWLS